MTSQPCHCLSTAKDWRGQL